MMSLWDALRMNMMISYQELVRTFLSSPECTIKKRVFLMPLPERMKPARVTRKQMKELVSQLNG
ncbi:hypothetical protein DZ695_29435, partial [Klebsiella pneumoniae]